MDEKGHTKMVLQLDEKTVQIITPSKDFKDYEGAWNDLAYELLLAHFKTKIIKQKHYTNYKLI